MDFNKLIEKHMESPAYEWATWGRDYFKGDNTNIMARSKKCLIDKAVVTDPFKANHRLGSLYNRILVKQLVNYLMGNGIQYKSDEDIEPLINTLGRDFQRLARQNAEQAGITGLAWLMPYVNKGQFKLKKIPFEQVIPIWNEYDSSQLDAVIRYYTVTKNDGKKDSDVIRIEYWTDSDVTYYIQAAKDSSKYVIDLSFEINPAPHFNRLQMVNGNNTGAQGLSWGRVPFVPLWWNDEKQNQLYTVKNWIDIYDITASDFANNIDDFQDVYWILKNYNGQDLGEFMTEVKRLRAIKVGDGGDASAQTIQIPTEARQAFLELARAEIFKGGMGVDTSNAGDGNITNVVIRSRYADLDLKANEFEGQLSEWWESLLYFVNVWHGLTGQPQYTDIELIYDRSMIINEIEMMDAVSRQKGIVSDVTMLENHPMVRNVDQELERIEEQAQANPVMLNLAGNNIEEPEEPGE